MPKKTMGRKTAERWFNLYIRLRDCDDNGYIKCVTCGKIFYFKEGDAGHFIHGLDFIDHNQHGQCRRCNYFLSGALDKYTEYMLKRFGQEYIDKLRIYKHTASKLYPAQINIIGQAYKAKAKALAKGKGLMI